MSIKNRYHQKGWRTAVVGLFFLTVCPFSIKAQVSYNQEDSLTICRLLEQHSKTDVLTLARHFIGTPYIAHTLEVNDHEQLVVNTRQLDCSTFVETVMALKFCLQQGRRTWNDYLHTLQQIRYRDGKLNGYPSRLHYFSDWIEDKVRMRMVEDIQSPNPPFSALQTVKVNFMSKHPQAYKALKENPELVAQIRQQEQALTGKTARYIPKSDVRNTTLMRQSVKDGDIIAITSNKPGLDIVHLGFAVWRGDGLHLLNASQLHHKVIEEPMSLRYYLSKHPTFTGIRIVRIK